jgi:hypothetical protein
MSCCACKHNNHHFERSCLLNLQSATRYQLQQCCYLSFQAQQAVSPPLVQYTPCSASKHAAAATDRSDTIKQKRNSVVQLHGSSCKATSFVSHVSYASEQSARAKFVILARKFYD